MSKRVSIPCIVLTLLLLMWQPSPAYACSCARLPLLSKRAEILHNFERSHTTTVFVGKVMEKRVVRPNFPQMSSADPVLVTFEVEQTYKGIIPTTVIISTPIADASCGFSFILDRSYLVFASGNPATGTANTGLCSGNIVSPNAIHLSALETSLFPYAGNNLLITILRAYTLHIVIVTGLLITLIIKRHRKAT